MNDTDKSKTELLQELQELKLELETIKMKYQNDITELKIAEEKLKISEEFNRRIVETAIEGIWVADSNEQVIFVNSKIADMLGYNIDEIIGKYSTDFLFEEDINFLNQKIEERKSGKFGYYEERLVRNDKTVLWAHISSTPLFDDNGIYTGSFAMLTDITERKIAEERLRESEELNKRIVETSIEGIWVADSNEKVIFVNGKIADMLGYTIDEIIGKSSTDFLFDEDINNLKQKIEERKAGKFGFYEERLVRKDFSVLWAHISSTPLFDNENKYTGSFAMLTDVTERKLAEEKLRLSEEFNRRIVETANEGIWVTDSNEMIFYVNEKMADMLGYTVNEMSDKYSTDFMFAEDINNIKQKIEERKKGKFGSYEERLARKDNKVLWVHISSSPLFDNKGVYTGSFAMLTDITERKIAEEEVNILSQAVEHCPASIVITDKNGIIEYVNPKFSILTGYSKEEVFGRNPRILKSNHTSYEYYVNLWNTILSGKVLRGELLNKKKNGELYWESASISPILNYKSEITHFVAINEDITELKNAEKLIHEKNEQQKILINNLPALIYFKDSELKYQLVNESFAKVLNLPVCEIIGKTDDEISPPELSKLYESLDKKIIETKESVLGYEVQHKNIEGMTFWEYTSKVPYCDDIGNVIGIIGIVQDITERKLAEEKLNKLYDELKTSNEIIEVNLYQKNFLIEELTESEAKLRETVAIKDKFFSIVAHDIRGPFSGFLGLTDLMVKEIDELSKDEIRHISSAINKSANAVYLLIEDLLTWSKSQTGTLPFIPEILDLHEICLNTLFALKQNANSKNIELINNIHPLTYINGDRNMLKTILRNLVSNAIKFSFDGGKIEIGINNFNTFEYIENSENYFEIYVKDNGIGIPESNLDKLFKIEEHYTTPGTRNETGTGLGLILCKEFIEKHGGKFWVESVEGKGSSFYFTLQKAK